MGLKFFRRIFGSGKDWGEVSEEQFSGQKAAPANSKDGENKPQESTMAKQRQQNSGPREAAHKALFDKRQKAAEAKDGEKADKAAEKAAKKAEEVKAAKEAAKLKKAEEKAAKKAAGK